jgi:hypothetical protein
MNIYFAASTQSLGVQRGTYEKIVESLRKQHVSVLDSWVVDAMTGKERENDSRVMLQKQHSLLQKADAIVAEVSTPSLGVGAMLMFGIEQHKPILCLYPDTTDQDVISESVKGLTSSLVTTTSYNITRLGKILQSFLMTAQQEHFQKFNFIASKKIADFITEQAKREQKTKSEFLRDFINTYSQDYSKLYAKEGKVI